MRKVEIESVARQYVMTHYGNMVQLGESYYEDESRLHRFTLRSNYPFMIIDDDDGEVRVRVLKMEKLGSVYVDDELHPRSSMCTTRKIVDGKVRDILAHWKSRIEQVVATTTSEKLAELDQFRQFFMPIQKIVYYTLEVGAISDSEVQRSEHRATGKLRRYVDLLEGEDLLQRTGGGWEPTILLREYEQKSDDRNQLVKKIISLMIRERYETLRQLMRLNMLHRVIRIQNVIYLPEIEEKHNLKRTRDTVRSEYYYHYATGIDEVDLVTNLVSLSQVGIVEEIEKKGLYSGDEVLLGEMVKVMEKLPTLSSLHQKRA